MKKTNTEPRSIQELESWQILEELAHIAAIKDELKALNLKADQSLNPHIQGFSFDSKLLLSC